jgi:hypothetical protein
MYIEKYIHPRRGLFGAMLGKVINWRSFANVRGAIMARLPYIKLASDVENVVYATWMVKVSRVTDLLPKGAILWDFDGYTPFTVLTYKHGNFGPELLGKLRRVFPSPMQSNWRLYLKEPIQESMSGSAPVRTVLFIKNVMSSVAHTVGSRLLSDMMPTHLPHVFRHEQISNGAIVEILPGTGSAPEFYLEAQNTLARELTPTLATHFKSWEEAVSFLALHDAAVARVPGGERVAYSEILLPIEPQDIQPLQTNADAWRCPLIQELGCNEVPFCFRVPQVKFRVLSETLLSAA